MAESHELPELPEFGMLTAGVIGQWGHALLWIIAS
jgi:hypothetical protein